VSSATSNPGVHASEAPGAPRPSRKKNNIEIIFTVKNEEMNLPFSIPAVKDWADKVWVVDSESTDRTLEIAREHGCGVRVQKWLGFAGQKNWAIDNLPIESDWVMIVDGDEVILPELRDEILKLCARPVDEVPEAAFYINRYFIFLGKRIRHCGYYPSWNIRLFKRSKARYEQRDVHEHMIADGPVGYLKGHMEHNDRRSLEVLMDKHNKYSTLEAREIFRVRKGQSTATFKESFLGNELERRRWIKHYLYPKLPCKWAFRFMYMYFLKLGFLDGITGFRFSMFITAYELLIHLKIIELELQEKDRQWLESQRGTPLPK
jgi:glycosyltransferase involved in cell wall biosynthesis